MSTKTFKFEYAPLVNTRSDLAQHRRTKLIERLQEQSKLAMDPTATTRTIKRKGADFTQKIRPQWRLSKGKVYFWMRGAAGKIEVAPGNFAIVVESVAVIPTMIEALIERVATGEFDAQLVKEKKDKKLDASKAKPASVPVTPKGRLSVVGKKRA